MKGFRTQGARLALEELLSLLLLELLLPLLEEEEEDEEDEPHMSSPRCARSSATSARSGRSARSCARASTSWSGCVYEGPWCSCPWAARNTQPGVERHTQDCSVRADQGHGRVLHASSLHPFVYSEVRLGPLI